MKKCKPKVTSNSSFITNQQLLEYMRNKSNKSLTPYPGCSQEKTKQVSLIKKKSYNLQMTQREKQNQSIISNNLQQQINCYQLSIEETLLKLLSEINIQVANITTNNGICRKIKMAIKLIQKIKSRLSNHQSSRQTNFTEAIQSQKQHLKIVQKQLYKTKKQNKMYEEEIKKLRNDLESKKQASISIPFKQKKQDKQKLHKIILRQSEFIQKQLEQKSNEKEDFLRVMRSQAQSLQSFITGQQKKDVKNDIMLNSLDLNCYLISSINLAEYQK